MVVVVVVVVRRCDVCESELVGGDGQVQSERVLERISRLTDWVGGWSGGRGSSGEFLRGCIGRAKGEDRAEDGSGSLVEARVDRLEGGECSMADG